MLKINGRHTNSIWIEQILKDEFGAVQMEYTFAKPRRFKFDFAIPEYKLAVEYEGIVSGKSRHTSITGYSTDCEKYNIAAIQGWTVLRYTALNISKLKDDIQTFQESIHIGLLENKAIKMVQI